MAASWVAGKVLLGSVANRGKGSFFQAWAWLAQEIEEKEVAPELYPYGSRGPVGSHYLAAKHGVRWGDNLSEEDQ